MATAVFLRFLDAAPSGVDSLIRAEYLVSGQGITKGKTLSVVVTVTALDTATTISTKLSTALLAVASQQGIVLQTTDILAPSILRGT